MPDWLKRLIRRIAALREPRQRAALFLDEVVKHPGDEVASVLRTIVAFGWRTRSREAKIVLDTAADAVASGGWPSDHFFEVYRAAESVDDALVAAMLPVPGETSEESGHRPLPIPPYAAERTLTLGERKSIAAKPDRALISLALMDPHPQVIEKLLSNSRITEDDVVYIAAKRPTSGAVLNTVSRHPKWRLRARVVSALIYNPHIPPATAVGLVHLLPPTEVANLETDPKILPEVRRLARELIRLGR